MTIESRGVECVGCTRLDLKEYPDHAKLGWGCCSADPPFVFVRVQMARNCASFDPAPEEIVTARVVWANKNPLPAWQR